jgi:S-adenosylmethionine:tRNA ribosyltransferase-isomerase
VLDRTAGTIRHHHFHELPALLRPGDRLVLNDSKVLPARLVGRRTKTEGKWEALFLRQLATGEWELLAQTRGYPQPGERFTTDTGLTLELLGRTPERHWLMTPLSDGSQVDLLTKYGEIPLPPYIRKGRAEAEDATRYQTVYAAAAGSVAAPTAGLHFTSQLFDHLTAQGVTRSTVTLHVGLGTFLPVKGDDPSAHVMHSEWCRVPTDTVTQIMETKANGSRVIAVGTTTTRTLESAAAGGQLHAFGGETALYIRPGFEFRVLDGLITNFHLPKSTLLLLVQAFSGGELLRRAYAEAVDRGYRFFSYGDAMLIV